MRRILFHAFFHKSNLCPLMRSFPDHLLLTRLRDRRIRNAGPSFLMFTVVGKSKSVEVRRTFARIKSSPSGTRRWWVSSLASDSRLTSQPKTCNLADKSSCVQPLRSRNSRTRVPIKFSGNEAILMLATVTAPDGTIVRFRSQVRLAQINVFRQDSRRPQMAEFGRPSLFDHRLQLAVLSRKILC